MTAQAGAALNLKLEWQSVDWKSIERAVRRLQARIVKAVQQGRWNKAKALQHLLTRSASAKLLAVRRVTENDGRKTPGVDNVLLGISPEEVRGGAFATGATLLSSAARTNLHS